MNEAAGSNADLVLEGGGVKGIGLVGAYLTLVDNGFSIRRVAGTSAGAIVGALIAARMPPDLMMKTMKELDYNRFQDKGFLDRLGGIGQGLSVLFEKGIYEGDALRNWLDGLLAELGTPTFGELRIDDDPGSALRRDRSYRLVVVVSDISRGELIYLPWDYKRYGLQPDEQRVADAVRASASIPFFYEPVQLAHPADNGESEISYLVDGGMLSNFPITCFDRPAGETPRWPTLGCKLSARPESLHGTRHHIDGVLSFAKALVGTMSGFHDRIHIDDPAVLARTIFVDTLDVKATDFDIDEATQDLLYENGRAAATKFLQGDGDADPGWDFARYIAEYRTSPST